MDRIRRMGTATDNTMEKRDQFDDVQNDRAASGPIEADEHLMNGMNLMPDEPEMTAQENTPIEASLLSGGESPVAETMPEAIAGDGSDSIAAEGNSQPLAGEAELEEVSQDPESLDQTVPLPIVSVPVDMGAESEELTPLPANAVVTGKYIVQSQLHHSAERNLYRVTPRHQQKCTSCGRLSSVDARNCEHCGTGLSKEVPADFYLMAESFQPELLIQDPTLMDLRLYHPNLVPVVDFFNYTPFGKTRYYAVAEPRQGVRLSQLSLPRPAMQVFGWALQLADALNYLHTRGVVGAGAEADDILVQGDMASLASLQNARVSQEESAERTQMQSIDLAKLAATIYEAYTGTPVTMGPDGNLPMPAQAPEKVGAAFRAAIEPVQGMAPPILAAQWRDLLTAALIAIAELEQPGRPVDFRAVSLSDVGRLRDQNQDSLCTAEFNQSSVERPMRMGLYVVADGMGGHKGGEIASAIAAQVFTAEVMARVVAPLATSTSTKPALSNEAILQGMARAVQSANERIFKARDNRQNDMGTTLVAALIACGKAYIVNVGDSRLYSFARQEKERESGQVSVEVDGTAPLAPGTSPLEKTNSLEDAGTSALTTQDEADGDFALTQISVDHSLVHRLVELGQLDPEEAKVHPHRNFIYRSLGGPPPVDVDTFVRTLHPGDRLLICSDGLNSMIEDSAIEEVLATEQDPNIACQRLIDLANEAGGHDNITTIVVDITDYLPQPEHPDALSN